MHRGTEDRHQNWEQQKQQQRDTEEDLAKDNKQGKEEKQHLNQELNVLEEKANRLKHGTRKSKMHMHFYFTLN